MIKTSAMNDDTVTKSTPFGLMIQTADGSWTIKHARHGQDFHSLEGARFEAHELYVVASGFQHAMLKSDPVVVLDVGLGLGYNATATIAAWLESDGLCNLDVVSLEIDSELVRALASGGAPWCEGWSHSWMKAPSALVQTENDLWSTNLLHPKSGRHLHWRIEVGDASQQSITQLGQGYQFIWQDPFTPELNPEMWSSTWFKRVRDVCAQDAKLMTYSVARVVKDALIIGGWQVERFPTPGRKRHWLRASPV